MASTTKTTQKMVPIATAAVAASSSSGAEGGRDDGREQDRDEDGDENLGDEHASLQPLRDEGVSTLVEHAVITSHAKQFELRNRRRPPPARSAW